MNIGPENVALEVKMHGTHLEKVRIAKTVMQRNATDRLQTLHVKVTKGSYDS